MQVFVIHDKKKAQTFVFSNHDAALKCRQELKLDHWTLIGCALNTGWENGVPVRQNDD